MPATVRSGRLFCDTCGSASCPVAADPFRATCPATARAIPAARPVRVIVVNARNVRATKLVAPAVAEEFVARLLARGHTQIVLQEEEAP